MMFRTIYFIKNFHKDELVLKKNEIETQQTLFSLGLKCHTYIGLNMICDCQTYISLSEWWDGIQKYGQCFAYLSQHFIFIYYIDCILYKFLFFWNSCLLKLLLN